MRRTRSKIAIIGCGNVGVRYAYATVIKGLAREIVMIDLDRDKVQGEVMDLSHGAPYYAPVDIRAGDYSDIVDSDIVVITAGKNLEPGQTRLDISRDNVEIFKKIIPQITKYAPEAVYLVVTNPVDVMAYATYKLSGKGSSEVIGSGTVLDTARFRYLLADHCGVASQNIHAYILGEHGDTEFPVWSRAMIGGVLFKDYCMVCKSSKNCDKESELKAIFENVRDAGYKIIQRKQETSYGVGMAMARITEAVLQDQNAILPVSLYVEDYLGVNDVYLSLPAVVNKNGVQEVLPLEFDNKEREQFITSANTLKGVIKECDL